MDHMSGLELIAHLNSLTRQKANLREELKKAKEELSKINLKHDLLTISISQIEDEIKSCKTNIRAEKE